MTQRDYFDYAKDILDSIEAVEDFTHGLTFEKFSKDKKTVFAVVRCIEVIGEAAKKIPEPLQKKYPSIPWGKMAQTRDKLIHAYFGIDIETIWKVAKDDLPPLKPKIQKVLKELE